MGFPFESASWDVVEGAMFIGWGTVMPGVYTLIAALICAYTLWSGNRAEQKHYRRMDK
jgi:hypothetical protein